MSFDPVAYAMGKAGITRSVLSALMAGDGGGGGVTIVPWSTGTDDEIVAMLAAAHAGSINLQTDGGWSVGDVRTITVSSFSDGWNVTQPQQDIDIVITSFDEYNSCGNVLQFDFKDALSASQQYNNTNSSSYPGSNYGGYGGSSQKMYSPILPNLVNALPEWLKNALISFDVFVSAGGSSSTIVTVSNNKLALRSEIEVFGKTTWSYAGEGASVSYYTASADNRKKKVGHSGSYGTWWLRSPQKDSTASFCNTSTSGTASADRSYQKLYIAPFGCL